MGSVLSPYRNLPTSLRKQEREPPCHVSPRMFLAIGGPDIPYSMVGGTIMMFAGLFLAPMFIGTKLFRLFLKQVSLTFSFAFSSLIFQQSYLILVTMIVTASSIRNLRAKTGLPLLNRIVGWAVLGTLLYLHTTVKTTDS